MRRAAPVADAAEVVVVGFCDCGADDVAVPAGAEVVVGWDPVVEVEWDPPVAAGCPVAAHDER